ncbi:glycosyltransferase family 39 protein [Streptomyces sp. NPDC046557]|uniref:glycosyltransferase family 39 protein n=1 Tax=Streptomyces sp. NPDC046557 TaxID=3155372 RepID=UPI0033D49FA9
MSRFSAAEATSRAAEPAGRPRARPPLRSAAATVALAAAVSAGVALRFIASSPLWLDEAQSVAIAGLPLHRLPQSLKVDGSPPLYYACLHLWMTAFGTGTVAVRSLSGVISVLSLPLFWLWGTVLGRTTRIGAYALAIASVNPWLIRYATETRMYSLVVLLVLLFGITLHRMRERPTLGRGAPVALTGGLLLLTHYWAIFLLAATAALLTANAIARPARRRDLRSALAVIAAALPFLPWAPIFTFQARHTGTPWATAPTLHALTSLVGTWSAGGRPVHAPLSLLLWPLLGTALLVRLPDGRRPALPLAAVTAVTLAIAFAACTFTDSAFTGRYTAVVVPAVLSIAALALTALPRRYLTPVLATLCAAWLTVAVIQAGIPRTQARQIADVINHQAAPGDTVVYCPDQLSPSTSRLVRRDVHEIPFPTAGDPSFVNWIDYGRRNHNASPSAFATALPDRLPPAAHLWLVTTDGYQTYGNKCTQLAHSLASRLGTPRTVVEPDRQTTYESATVLRFDSPAAHA